jgi:hypothetical protein
MKSSAPTPPRRPVWVPPTRDRLRSIDLGPLRSPTTTSIFSKSIRSPSVSISSAQSLSEPVELDAIHGPYELEALESKKQQKRVEEDMEQLESLQEALRVSEIQRKALETKINGLQGNMRAVGVSRKSRVLREPNVEERPISETSQDESLEELRRSLTVKYVGHSKNT